MNAIPNSDLGRRTETEIFSQPETWQHVLDLPATSLNALPSQGMRVLGLGCGTSYFMLDSYARRRMQLDGGFTRVAVPTELDDPTAYDVVLALSRSGTTADLLPVVEEMAAHTQVACITATPGSPLTDLAHQKVLLDFADETSVVQTRFATTALTLLRRSIGDDVGELSEQVRSDLDEPSTFNPGRYEHFVFLGTGWTLGLAHEAALKCREAAQIWTESYPVFEYRHGPIACAGTKTLIWSLEQISPALKWAIEKTGATLRVNSQDPQVELTRVYRMAVALSRIRGVDADRPPHLTRSVIHE